MKHRLIPQYQTYRECYEAAASAILNGARDPRPKVRPRGGRVRPHSQIHLEPQPAAEFRKDQSLTNGLYKKRAQTNTNIIIKYISGM